MKFCFGSIGPLALFLSLGYLPALAQPKVATCDPRLGLVKTEPVGYTKSRWQDAEDAEGGPNPTAAREVRNVLRFGMNAIPLLIGCLTDESKTKYRIGGYWPEPKVRDLAFSILCDLFTDRMRNETIDGAIMWSDIQDESPNQAAWIAWGIYNDKHGQQYLQKVWLKAWTENKTRIYWDNSDKCFKVKKTP